MKSKAQSVDEYLAELAPERRAALQTLRTLVREVAPTATETMQYGMATYTLGGAMPNALASQKNHLALYGLEETVVEPHRAELGKLDCGKGCLRFQSLDDLSLEVVRTMLQDLATERLRPSAA